MSLIMTATIHIPVLLKESTEALNVRPGGRYIDCTIGTGGHALAILEKSSPGGQLLGIDADPEAIAVSSQRLNMYSRSLQLANDNFANLSAICSKYDFHPVDGIIFDLGVSTLQLETEIRGFSFLREGPLDMRFSPTQWPTAAEIVNNYPEKELASLLYEYGQERHSRLISRYVARNRPITSTHHLVEVIEQATRGKRGRIHPATRSFQALRIAVNKELSNLQSALKQTVDLLRPEGRLVVISYHSLEDRMVKDFLRQEEKECLCPAEIAQCTCGHKPTLKILTKKVIIPSPVEKLSNPRSHSAKMRVAERLSSGDDTFIDDQDSVAKIPSGSSKQNIIKSSSSPNPVVASSERHCPSQFIIDYNTYRSKGQPGKGE